MHCLPTFEKIKRRNIEYSEEWSLHPFLSPTPPDRLCSSIDTVGLLHPPILKRLAQNRYQVLCGRFRLRAVELSNTQIESIVALVLNEQTSLKQLLQYVLEDQLLTGNLSPMEKAYFFNCSIKHIGIDATTEIFHSILGDNIQNHLINKSLLLLNLESEIQYSVHNGRINEKLAFDLLQLDSTDRLTLHNLFQDLELGGGKQKRLLTLCKDLAYRQGKTITSLLLEPDLANVLDHPEINRPQKAATLLAALQTQLFPQSSSAEDQFKKCVNRMKLPPSCTISHSQAFEKDEVSVTLHFKSLAEVESRLVELKKITHKVKI
jgi:ParB family transcriptional regulator, chromosome partitioning protein